jgi:hypothetical protein
VHRTCYSIKNHNIVLILKITIQSENFMGSLSSTPSGSLKVTTVDIGKVKVTKLRSPVSSK